MQVQLYSFSQAFDNESHVLFVMRVTIAHLCDPFDIIYIALI